MFASVALVDADDTTAAASVALVVATASAASAVATALSKVAFSTLTASSRSVVDCVNTAISCSILISTP